MVVRQLIRIIQPRAPIRTAEQIPAMVIQGHRFEILQLPPQRGAVFPNRSRGAPPDPEIRVDISGGLVPHHRRQTDGIPGNRGKQAHRDILCTFPDGWVDNRQRNSVRRSFLIVGDHYKHRLHDARFQQERRPRPYKFRRRLVLMQLRASRLVDVAQVRIRGVIINLPPIPRGTNRKGAHIGRSIWLATDRARTVQVSALQKPASEK